MQNAQNTKDKKNPQKDKSKEIKKEITYKKSWREGSEALLAQ